MSQRINMHREKSRVHPAVLLTVWHPYVFHDEYMLHARSYSCTTGETHIIRVGSFVSYWLQQQKS
jgi:hypothetical protein